MWPWPFFGGGGEGGGTRLPRVWRLGETLTPAAAWLLQKIRPLAWSAAPLLSEAAALVREGRDQVRLVAESLTPAATWALARLRTLAWSAAPALSETLSLARESRDQARPVTESLAPAAAWALQRFLTLAWSASPQFSETLSLTREGRDPSPTGLQESLGPSATWALTVSGPPGAPRFLMADPNGSGGIDLSWSAPVSGGTPTGYRIYRSSSAGGARTKIGGDRPASPLSYSDSPGAGTWYYVVHAFNAQGESGDSNQANATI